MVVQVDKFTVQCSLVGDAMIGKSSLAKAITGEQFQEGYIATTEDNYSASLSVAGDKYSLSILDLSGQVIIQFVFLMSFPKSKPKKVLFFSISINLTFFFSTTLTKSEHRSTGPMTSLSSASAR